MRPLDSESCPFCGACVSSLTRPVTWVHIDAAAGVPSSGVYPVYHSPQLCQECCFGMGMMEGAAAYAVALWLCHPAPRRARVVERAIPPIDWDWEESC